MNIPSVREFLTFKIRLTVLFPNYGIDIF